MAGMNMPVLSKKWEAPADMPQVSGRQSRTSSAAPRTTGGNTTASVPQSTTPKAASGSWKTKTVQKAVGAGRGGRVDYAQVEVPTLAGRVAPPSPAR